MNEVMCTQCKVRDVGVVGCIDAPRDENDMPTLCMYCCGDIGDCQDYWGSQCCVKEFGEIDAETAHIADFKPDCPCCINECPKCREDW